MKILKSSVFAFLIILSISLFSCSSDDDSASSQDPETFIRFTVDGTTYQFEDIATASSLNLTINGQVGLSEDVDYSSISIWFPLNPATGTNDFSGDFFEDGDYKLNLESNPLNIDDWATSGSVTLSSINSDFMTGTFSATITNDNNIAITIENGEFKAYGL